MKALKIARIILLAVAATLVGVSFILGKDGNGALMVVMNTTNFYLIGAGIGFGLAVAGSILLFSKNKIALALGIGFTVSFYLATLSLLFVSGATILVLLAPIGSIVYAVSWALELIRVAVAHTRRDDLDPTSDPKIEAIIKWRNLLDKKIITEEEFMEKRNAILGFEKPAEEK